MDIFGKLADKGLYGCILVVAIDSRNGVIWGYFVHGSLCSERLVDWS